jgi:alpha-mannosidase
MNFFTIEKLEKQMKEIRLAVHRGILDIPIFKYIEGLQDGENAGVHCPDFDDSGWSDFQVGRTWGGYDIQAWFRAWVTIPESWREQKLGLHFVIGPRDGGGSTAETLLYVNGVPLQGLDIWHEEAWLPPEHTAQSKIMVALKAWSGVLNVPDRRRFKVAQLVWIDEGAERFYSLANTVLKTVKLLPESDLRRVRLLENLNAGFRLVDFFRPNSEDFYNSLQDAYQFLNNSLNDLEIFEIKPTVVGVGHSHIDMAWLWRLAHTREKASRTFSTVLHLMRQYPDYRFMHTSPQLYNYLKEDYPQIYEQVRRRVTEGRWEVTGGMWVEADTNLTSGESLVRQFLYGRRFIREEFGKETNILWLPDVFGYPASLPQIAVKCGMKYFLTSKISWSQFNRFPYDTFSWRGLDGTEILSHFITTPEENSTIFTYNGPFEPADVKGIWENYRQKDVNDELLFLYGWGDGGGGPTREMLETAQSLRNLPGMPVVKLDTAEAYFARLSERLEKKALPVWDGELYLEYHRGTYTSQAFIKRANRRSEVLYHDAEWFNALAQIMAVLPSGSEESLREGWELILLNQFHDILPGSSIREVYDDSREQYKRVEEVGLKVLVEARDCLVEKLSCKKSSLIAFNSLSWERGGLVELPLSSTDNINMDDMQVVEGKDEPSVLIEIPPTPSMGYAVYSLESRVDKASAYFPIAVTEDRMENKFYRILFNACGQIVSIYDKRCSREVLTENERGNVLQVFEDKPLAFDAWDIDIYYQEKMLEVDHLIDRRVKETGPLRGVLSLVWRFGDSIITQLVTIYHNSPRIDFRTHIEWREQQALLKTAFPVAVRSTRAAYDIQFGNVERPTHWNTSWDYARFESVGHKWVDLSEGDYGVSLLNDCKYGHDIKDNVIRLTLLKSAIDPDKTADKGSHSFVYSLLPHSGGWREGNIPREAYELNYPLHVIAVDGQQDVPQLHSFSLASLSTDHVMLETVKKAENGNGWIVRIYEFEQRRNPSVKLRFGKDIALAEECNLVEEDSLPAVFSGNEIELSILPYEIKTFRVWFK